MMFELRIHYIIWSLYCEPAPSFTLQAQANTPSIYLYTHVLLALTVGFQVFSPSPTYIPDSICGRVLIRPPLGDGKYGLIRGVASREGYIR